MQTNFLGPFKRQAEMDAVNKIETIQDSFPFCHGNAAGWRVFLVARIGMSVL